MKEFAVKRFSDGTLYGFKYLGARPNWNPFDNNHGYYVSRMTDSVLNWQKREGFTDVFWVWDGRFGSVNLNQRKRQPVVSDADWCNHAYCLGQIAEVLGMRE